MKRQISTALFGCVSVLFAASNASAHVVLTEKTATAGAYHAAFFRVGHGCQNAATTAITIHIPEQTPKVQPQPKAGWSIDIQSTEDRITSVTWQGLLPNEQFDDFGLMMKLPAQAQDLPFSVTQTCGEVTSRWDGHAPAYPQPVLSVLDTAQPTTAHPPHSEHS